MKLAKLKHMVRPLPERRKVEAGFWNAAVPSVCTVPLQQHMGGRLEPTVTVGDTVREGSVIGSGSGRFSSLVHAPIPGTVVEIGEMTMADGRSSIAVSIELAGEFDRLGKTPAAKPWESLEAPELVALLRDAGVICASRSGVPIHAMLSRRHMAEQPRVILDLAETEPYLHAEMEVATTLTRSVLEGVDIVRKIISAREVAVVLNRERRSGTRNLRDAIQSFGYSLRYSNGVYPANLDHQLLATAFRIRLLADQMALDRNVCVISPGTALAIYEAVAFQKPQIDRVVTVAGGAVRRPANIRVRIGTPIVNILEECGGLTDEGAQIVLGGPLTGRTVENINAPITKRDAAVLALTSDEVSASESFPCTGCGACVRACPVSLDPIFLLRLIRAGRTEQSIEYGLDRCTECGLCSHVCPSRVPLASTIRRARVAGRGVA